MMSKSKHKVGDYRTPVVFYGLADDDFSPEPNSESKTESFKCLALCYSPSAKDYTIMNAHSVTEGMTIVIPDTRGEFVPDVSMTVKIEDYRFKNTEWNVVEVVPDLEENKYIKVVLGAVG